MAPQKINFRGFTILELVIALAVIGTLLTIAMPSYQQYVRRAERADAVRVIMAAADCQSRVRAETGTFDTTRCLPDSTGSPYRFSIRPPGQVASQDYTIIATPLQEDRQCDTLSLDHTGLRSVSHPGGNVAKCWGGR